MKIIFAGTPEFSAIALEALIKSTHEIIAVYTQPDRPAGRGLKLTASPVKTLAVQHGLSLYQPVSLKSAEEQATLKKLGADIMVVAAYGLLLPQAVLDIPRFGCVNIHPSLLPRWRGAAPIQRTIFSGDKVTGVCIMQMDAGLDTGPVLLKHEYALEVDETTQTLHDKLAKMGADSLVEALELIESGKASPESQDNSHATYAEKIKKEEAIIKWDMPAHTIDCQIRAFNPWPMAYTHLHNERIRIGKAVIQHKDTYFVSRSYRDKIQHGMIVSARKDGIDVVTGDDKLITLLELQLPGGKMLTVSDFYNAHQTELKPGTCFS